MENLLTTEKFRICSPAKPTLTLNKSCTTLRGSGASWRNVESEIGMKACTRTGLEHVRHRFGATTTAPAGWEVEDKCILENARIQATDTPSVRERCTHVMYGRSRGGHC